MSENFEDQVLYQGDVWQRLDTVPRILAEGWQHTLAEAGIVSMVRTPFQWADLGPLLGTNYGGDVALYVLKAQWDDANRCLDGDPEDQNQSDVHE